jgi:type VI secretion system protein ImpL
MTLRSTLTDLWMHLGAWAWWLLAFAVVVVLLGSYLLLRKRDESLGELSERVVAWSRNLVLALRYLTTNREWRYRNPWILMVGERMSGRTALAQSLPHAQRAAALLREAELQVPDSQWTVLDGGVLIEIADLEEPDEQKVLRHWRAVLRDINTQRPERPLDAVVLTLSARTLLSDEKGAQTVLAQRVYQRLFDLQKRLSFTFPVYVVVTQCDAVEGFEPFFEAHDPARLDEIFGWSSPYSLQHAFEPAWVDQAFAKLRDDLLAAQLLAAGQSEVADADAFFLFPRRFEALHGPLRNVLREVFRPASYHDSFMVRGIYFTGRVSAAARRTRAPEHRIAFTADLFEDRIFRECNLARPTQEGILSRNRLLRRVQLGMLAGSALLFFLLALTGARLSHEADIALAVFGTLDPSQAVRDDGDCNRERIEAVARKLGDLSNIDFRLRHLLIPASWFDDRVFTAVARGISQDVLDRTVMPTLRCRLEQMGDQLLDEPVVAIDAAQAPGRAVAAAREDASGYVDHLLAFHQALNQYRAIVRLAAEQPGRQRPHIFDDFAGLTEYVYGHPLPRLALNNPQLLGYALSNVKYRQQPELPPDFIERAAQRVQARAAQMRQQIDHQLARGAQIAAAIERDDPQVRAGDLEAWLAFADEDWLSAAAGADPCALARTRTTPGVERLIGEFGYPATMKAALSPFSETVAPDAEGCRAYALKVLQQTSFAPYGTVALPKPPAAGAGSGTPQLRAADWVAGEREGLEGLRDLSFTGLTVAGPFTCRAPLRGFDGALIAEADGYAYAYQAFRERRKLPPPAVVDEQKKPLYDRLARRQLQQVFDDRVNRAQETVAGAQTREDAWLAPNENGDERLNSRARNFAQSGPQLQQLLGLYAQFGLDSRAIAACARDFASGELDAANRLAEASSLYAPPSDPRAVGDDADSTRSYFDLGTPADTRLYLDQQFERAQVLAGYATPFVQFLEDTPASSVGGADDPHGPRYWLATINEINRYTQGKDPKGQVAVLHGYVQDSLRIANQDNCDAAVTDDKLPDLSLDAGLFAARYNSLIAQTDDYCAAGRSALARVDYQQLASRFNSELAGLFPFGPLSSTDAPLLATKRFFTDYSAQRKTLRKKVHAADGNERWNQVEEFLNQLDAVADFFQVSLAAGPRSQPIGLGVSFRYQPPGSAPDRTGAAQLVGWRFDSGEATASYPNGATAVNWQFGDPVTLTLTWALRSAFRPQSAETPSDPQVSERTLSASATGPWSLLRLIAEHRDSNPQSVDPLNDRRVVTAFDVPLKLIQPPGTDVTDSAELLLALDLQSGSGDTAAPVAVPAVFPNKAPDIW